MENTKLTSNCEKYTLTIKEIKKIKKIKKDRAKITLDVGKFTLDNTKQILENRILTLDIVHLYFGMTYLL